MRGVEGGNGLRVPPQNLEAEAGVLGGIALDADAMPDVRQFVSPESFYSPANQIVFAAMEHLYESGLPIDAISVSEELNRIGSLEKIGGVAYIGELLTTVPHASHSVYYARLVQKAHLQRMLIYSMQDSLGKLYDQNADPSEVSVNVEQVAQSVQDQIAGEQAAVTVSQAIDNLQNRQKDIDDGKFQLVKTGLPMVDQDHPNGGMLGGWYNMIGARPGQGKTTILTQMLADSAESGNPSILYSLEAEDFNIASEMLKQRNEESARRLPMWIDDKTKSITAIIADIRRKVRLHGVRMVGLDYIQLVHPHTEKDDRRTQLERISRAFMDIRKELGIAVVILAQLNADAEGREPHKGDLSQCKTMVQDVDCLMFLWRPDPKSDISKLKIDKIRYGGRLGTHELKYNYDTGRVEENDLTFTDSL